MDRIGDFAKYYGCEPANENAGILAALFGVLAFEIAAIGIINKVNAKKVTANQQEYFRVHEIPEHKQKGYAKMVTEKAREDVRNVLTKTLNDPKSKRTLDTIRDKIIGEVYEYIDGDIVDEKTNEDGSVTTTKRSRNDRVFEREKLKIRFGCIEREPGEFEMVEVEYTGKGFIPMDNLWEIGCMACDDIMHQVYKGVIEQYKEEIKCRFVTFHYDNQYGTISVG